MSNRGARFLALLRGINVGGKNIIKKDALAECFVDNGFSEVTTYIQSGNVIFDSTESTNTKELTRLIEQGLSKRFKYDAQAVVYSRRTYASLIKSVPSGWGTDDSRKHNAMFMVAGMTPKQALAMVPPPKTDIETVTTGPGVIFWSVSKKHLTRATMMKLAASDAYQSMTVRNHNTTFKLKELLERT